MSLQYDKYLSEHISNVESAWIWLKNNLSKYFNEYVEYDPISHDESKFSQAEYYAYDEYFYGDSKNQSVVDAFNLAWLHHIHHNPHHWQHWILIEDKTSNKEPYLCIEMPRQYVLEMIADWWSFSWKTGNLHEIFDWYDSHKSNIKLHKNTRELVESILSDIKQRLDEGEKI